MGFLDGLFQRSPLKVEPTPQGPRVLDTRTGLSWVAPGEGELIPPFPESPVSPAFDGGFRLRSHPVEVRLRVEAVRANPRLPAPAPDAPPLPVPEANGELAHDLCIHYSDQRTDGEPLVGLAQAWQLEDWRVDGAASAIYPLDQPEGRFDMEECHVLVKSQKAGAPQAIVLMKLFSTKDVTPVLWNELNGRMNETLAWGGEPKVATPRALSFYVNASMELTAEARAAAKRLGGELRAASVAAKVVQETASAIEKFAYASDPPDAPLAAEVRELLPPALLEPIAAPALRAAIERELAERVKTYRDFRGLHLFLEAASKELV
jgi:hypothetical protein